MLTLFSIPKPFRGHINIIQRNAIKSWTLLRPECEVILFGDDEGTAELAAELELRHFPEVEKTEFGTPMISDIFKKAAQLADNPTICYVNADIILKSDFIESIKRAQKIKERSLIIGQHWRLDVEKPIDFDADWEEWIAREVDERGEKGNFFGVDFFVYGREEPMEMPPMAVGRPRWDNWVVYKALSLSMPVIDITDVAMVIHQNHDYGHVPKGDGVTFEGPEAEKNLEMLKEYGEDERCGFNDVTYMMTPKGLRRAMKLRHILRLVNVLAQSHFLFKPVAAAANASVVITRPMRMWYRKRRGPVKN